MKLRNKKTGEIIEFITGDTFNMGGIQILSLRRNPQIVLRYNSIAKLNEDWEDYEEPKTIFFINEGGSIDSITNIEDEELAELSVIGNCFETCEEAEKAVEKLKAFKRLKNKGFKFLKSKIIGEYGVVEYKLTFPATIVEEQDLDLLFGGKE